MDKSGSWQFSRFGEKFTRQSGILQLMDDLGRALAGGQSLLMLGGGNPGQVPGVQAVLREAMQNLLADGSLERMLGNYAGQQGDAAFLEALAGLFRETYGWPVSAANIALSNGSQNGFFFLFNLFSGDYRDGRHKRVLLPMAPEYIGYSDLSLSEDGFVSARPGIELLDPHTFKYRVDFDALHLDDSIGALCVSRPTNPTGNVITDAELARLGELARGHGVPLIIDGAYGTPFPNVIYSPATPHWDSDTILCLSLSKLGLPAVRTGIVVAAPEVVQALAALNAVINLTPASIGTTLLLDLVRSGEILRLSREVVQPFYQARMEQAVAALRRHLDGTPYRLHVPEGAFFLWLWLPGLPGGSRELYQRLKARGVLVVPGDYFFPGLEGDDWEHKRECIRISYAQDPEVVEAGLKIIGDEVKRSFNV